MLNVLRKKDKSLLPIPQLKKLLLIYVLRKKKEQKVCYFYDNDFFTALLWKYLRSSLTLVLKQPTVLLLCII